MRDYFNLSNLNNLPDKTSVIVEERPKSFGMPSQYTQNTTSYLTYETTRAFDRKPTYSEWGGYTYRPTEEQLFTDPKLLEMMKSDLSRIQSKQYSNYGLLP